MTRQAAVVHLICLFLASTGTAAGAKTGTSAAKDVAVAATASGPAALTLPFARSLHTLFAIAAEHRVEKVTPDGATVAENLATNVMVARRNPDGTMTIRCLDDEASARRFFEAASQKPAAAASEVK
jgi:hypothetical protein